MSRILAAVAFLTRVPLRRPFEGADVGRATLAFPLVGAAIGALLYGASVLVASRLPTLLAATILVALSAWVTRALHLDGLGDLVDGLGGGGSRDDALRIMRDSRIGAFGAVALVLLILIKVAALDAILSRDVSLPTLVLTPALARWASVPMSYWLPYARAEGGLGSALADHVGFTELLGATLISLALVAVLAPRLGGALWAAVLVTSLVMGAIVMRRLGGVTGDVLGANVELSEAAAFVVAVLVTTP